MVDDRGMAMLQTKEEIKKAIRDYLVNLPSKTKQFEGYTLSKISETVKADSSKVNEAISELKEEGLLDSRKIQLDIYIPKTEGGFEALTTYAKKGYVSFSPYWAVFFGFALLSIGVYAWGDCLNIPTGIETLFDAYLMGIRHGIVSSFVVGLIGGILIQNVLSKFRRWQIVSEEAYETISSLVKYTIYIFAALGISYYVVANQLGYPVELSVVIALLGIAAASAIGYKQIASRKKVG